jgi:hypothetical protein
LADQDVLRWRGFSLPKRGNAPEECEDAFAGDPAAGRFAVADGASESAFAGAWARVLVEACVATPERWSSWLQSAQARWQAQFEHQDMPWFVEGKFAEGACATLLGVAVDPPAKAQPRSWKARAVGDCCLFHVRQGSLLGAFPVTRSTDFDNQPALLSSRSRAPRIRRQRMTGDWQDHDSLLLMSDALAQWFLLAIETGRRPWEALSSLQTEKDFAQAIEELRDQKELRNDDVTLLTIR